MTIEPWDNAEREDCESTAVAGVDRVVIRETPSINCYS